MTIYFALAKEKIEATLKFGNEKALLDDNTYLNMASQSVSTFFKWGNVSIGRDPVVGSGKRAITDECRMEIRAFEGAENDADNFTQLSKILDKYEDKAIQLKEDYFDTSNMGVAFNACHLFLRKFKTELRRGKLLDISVDADPLNQFRYQIARYIKHMIEEHTTLAVEKKNAALAHLAECMVNLEDLGETKDNYENARRKVVLASIRNLRIENARLTDGKASRVQGTYTISICTLSIDQTLFVPGLGELEGCCSEAIKSISGGSRPEHEVVPYRALTM